MTGNRMLLAMALAAIVILALIYLMPGRSGPLDQQASPHAINQPG